MKNVLIIANLVHAAPRIPNVAAYLPEFGWDAAIIAPPLAESDAARLGFPERFWKSAKIFPAPYQGDIFWRWRKIMAALRFKKNQSLVSQVKENLGLAAQKSIVEKMFYGYQELFAWPDTESTWIKPALAAGRDVLQKQKFDAIISSSPYPTNHIVARILAQEFNLRWLVDFRDPWTQNHNYQFSKWRRRREEALEKETIACADAVMAAAPAYAEKQQKFYGKPVAAVANGFDPEAFESPDAPLAEKFTIVYTGTIYRGKQEPRKFLAAVAELIEKKVIDGKRTEVSFYGPVLDWLGREISGLGLEGVVFQRGTVGRLEAAREQKRAHLLLLLNWEDQSEPGVYPLKFFEYLGARRPIFAAGGFEISDIKNIIKQTGVGDYAFSAATIKEILGNYYREYLKTGKTAYRGRPFEVLKYSWRQAAKATAGILDSIIKNSQSHVSKY
jgi:hypothetical protein